MESVAEVWRAVPGEEFYEASDIGRVRSLDRYVSHWRGGTALRKGKILKLTLHHTGYLVAKIGAYGQMRVHQMVARAFIGPQKDGLVVNHIDGDKHNNRPSNLEYITNTENVKHAYRTGLLSNCGTTNGKATLTEEKVRLIRNSFGTHAAVAEIVGCSKAQVSQVRSGKTWGHVA